MDKDIKKWTVASLKHYLKARAIPHSGYSKDALVLMVENSMNSPQLTSIRENDDGEETYIRRRTIEVNGTCETFPDPYALTGWDTNLITLPPVTSAKCLVYLLSKMKWSSERTIAYEKERGYQLFLDKHVTDVVLKHVQHQMIFVRGTCIRQTSQNEKPYQVWLLLSAGGSIETAGCQCIGDDGGCKHVVAVMFAVAHHLAMKGDPANQLSVTDQACMWDKPRKSCKQVKAVHLDYRKNTSSERPFPPRSGKYRACTLSESFSAEDAFQALMSKHGEGTSYAPVLYPPKEQNLPPNIPELAEAYIKAKYSGSFLEYVQQKLSPADIDILFAKTHAQHKSNLWKQQRIGAITSTTMHKAVQYKHNQTDNYIVKEVMGKSSFQGNRATKYGKNTEPVAKKLYIEHMKKKHKNFKVTSCGLFIKKDNPLIRATPDGVVSCKCCGIGLLEIKCPYSDKFRPLSGRELAESGTYSVTLGENGDIKLKKSCPWYTQIQTHLGVSGYQWCDFVMFTEKSPHLTVDRIYFDHNKFDSDCNMAMDFYNKFVLPKLMI